MLTFKEHMLMEDYEQLDEKLIMYNQGKKYGQVVFLAGGAGSGKGFAQSNFMEVDKFKVFDVDELKKLFIKVRDLNMNLKNPKDVFDLHMMVKKSGVKEKRLLALADSISKSGSKGTLPNLMFDVTLKEIEDIKEMMPMLIALGYDSKSIHVTWVLADYYVAVKANQERDRVVPDDILLQTHIGAAKTMSDIVKGKLPRGVDGEVRVILNNRENTIPYTDANGKPIKGSGSGKIVVKDFTYVTLKKAGKKFENEASVQKQVFNWISKNVPKDAMRQIEVPKQ
jgi:dephospho-CoA kinase